MAYYPTEEIEKLKKELEGANDVASIKEILTKILEVSDTMAHTIEEFDHQIFELDSDLAELEDYVYLGEEGAGADMLEFTPEGTASFEMKCPACNELVTIELTSSDSDKIVCPNCKAELNFDSGCCCGCGGCDCGAECDCTKDDNCGCDCDKDK